MVYSTANLALPGGTSQLFLYNDGVRVESRYSRRPGFESHPFMRIVFPVTLVAQTECPSSDCALTNKVSGMAPVVLVKSRRGPGR